MGSYQGSSHILNRSGYKSSFARRSRRGAALLVTVLITIAAATITLVLVKQGLDTARNESNKSASQIASMAVGDLRLDFERELQKNPTFFLEEVYENESPRICAQGEDTAIYAPGDKWPSDCGTSWTYEAATDASSVVKITPPGSSSSTLHVEYAVKVGTASMGLQTEYVPNSPKRALVASTSDLDLNALAYGDFTTSLGGLIYAKGNLTLPSSPAVTSSNAIYASENLVAGEVPAGSTVASQDASQAAVRDYQTTPLTSTDLNSSLATLNRIACAPSNQDSRALCLEEGKTVYTSSGDLTEIPAAKAWMVLPSEASPNLLELYYSNVDASYPSACAADCSNILNDSQASSFAGTHPGASNYWTQLPGEFKYPQSGVLYSPTTLYLGFCGEAFLNSVSECATRGPIPATSSFSGSLTVVAGSLESPKDAFISGPVMGSEQANLALLASGNVIIPNWAHVPGKDLNLELAITAMGDNSSPSIRSLPLNPLNHDKSSFSANLNIKGSLVGNHVTLPTEGFNSAKFYQDVDLLKNPAPYIGTGSLTWGETKSLRLTPEQLFELF